jgi:hypothetical protein
MISKRATSGNRSKTSVFTSKNRILVIQPLDSPIDGVYRLGYTHTATYYSTESSDVRGRILFNLLRVNIGGKSVTIQGIDIGVSTKDDDIKGRLANDIITVELYVEKPWSIGKKPTGIIDVCPCHNAYDSPQCVPIHSFDELRARLKVAIDTAIGLWIQITFGQEFELEETDTQARKGLKNLLLLLEQIPTAEERHAITSFIRLLQHPTIRQVLRLFGSIESLVSVRTHLDYIKTILDKRPTTSLELNYIDREQTAIIGYLTRAATHSSLSTSKSKKDEGNV